MSAPKVNAIRSFNEHIPIIGQKQRPEPVNNQVDLDSDAESAPAVHSESSVRNRLVSLPFGPEEPWLSASQLWLLASRLGRAHQSARLSVPSFLTQMLPAAGEEPASNQSDEFE